MSNISKAAPPTRAHPNTNGTVTDLIDEALKERGEWFAVNLDELGMTKANAYAATLRRIGQAFGDVQIKSGVVYVRVKPREEA